MATKTKQWSTGTGSATIQYDGQGDGEIIITSDPNSVYEARSMQITVETTDGSGIQRTITIQQAAKQRIDISAAVVTAATQTYSGSAKTPTPTVTLNGSVIPSTGYDVAYNNNTNAGTATITITGKGDYTGTASGTFTIAKASRTLNFADTYMVLNTSSTGTKTATPSAGSGDGAITYSIANTTYATINSSSGKVTSKTSDGSVTVTATLAEGNNYLGATATYTLYVFATTHNYSYTGSAKSVTLPPGSYKLQCWGAQGGSNSADSTYGITSQPGGKGGYAEGVLTVSSATGVKVCVGGQGGSTAAGWNGGGSSTGSSQNTISGEFGITKMAGGGGATDIRLSSGTLLSRMIVAGGGSGGACCYRNSVSYASYKTFVYGTAWGSYITASNYDTMDAGTYRVTFNGPSANLSRIQLNYDGSSQSFYSTTFEVTLPSSVTNARFLAVYTDAYHKDITFTVEEKSGSEELIKRNGFEGGGETGYGYTPYQGKQNAAGTGGSFGQGANQNETTYKYAGAAGGGGWYGGGRNYGNYDTMSVSYSGGGSGWVNTADSASNRPSGYTGLQLDSGETIGGRSSFPSTGGGTEYGHSGNGYVRITRIS